MDDEEMDGRDERTDELFRKLVQVAKEGGYEPVEVVEAASRFYESTFKGLLLLAVFGDEAERIIDALNGFDTEELIREAEGVLRNDDEQG